MTLADKGSEMRALVASSARHHYARVKVSSFQEASAVGLEEWGQQSRWTVRRELN